MRANPQPPRAAEIVASTVLQYKRGWKRPWPIGWRNTSSRSASYSSTSFPATRWARSRRTCSRRHLRTCTRRRFEPADVVASEKPRRRLASFAARTARRERPAPDGASQRAGPRNALGCAQRFAQIAVRPNREWLSTRSALTRTRARDEPPFLPSHRQRRPSSHYAERGQCLRRHKGHAPWSSCLSPSELLGR